jgi:hypothetical protein
VKALGFHALKCLLIFNNWYKDMTALFDWALMSPQMVTGIVWAYLETPQHRTADIPWQDAIYSVFEQVIVREYVRRVVFVDVDGVLLAHDHSTLIKKAAQLKYAGGKYDDFDRDCVATEFFSISAMSNLQTVLKTVSDCALVLSSNWRTSRSQYQLRTKIFARFPWFARALISKTEDLANEYASPEKQENYRLYPRRIEINVWLTKNPSVEHFAIIDDVDKGLSLRGKRFVHVNPFLLLTANDTEKVIEALRQ